MRESPTACSGLMEFGVPITAPAAVKSDAPIRASPKSVILGSPASVIRTLAGFKSRSTMPFRRAVWIAAARRATSRAASRGVGGVRRTQSDKVPPGTYSNARNLTRSAVPYSNSCTIEWCCRAATASASTAKRANSIGLASRPPGSTFSATTRLTADWTAR